MSVSSSQHSARLTKISMSENSSQNNSTKHVCRQFLTLGNFNKLKACLKTVLRIIQQIISPQLRLVLLQFTVYHSPYQPIAPKPYSVHRLTRLQWTVVLSSFFFENVFSPCTRFWVILNRFQQKKIFEKFSAKKLIFAQKRLSAQKYFFGAKIVSQKKIFA